MPRRKQYCPKRHENGENTSMPEDNTTDQQQSDPTPPPVHSTEPSKSPSPDQTEDEKKCDVVLDLSVRKRRRSQESGRGSPAKCPNGKSTPSDTTSPDRSSANDAILGTSAFSAVSQSSAPFFPLYLSPPYRFPPFASSSRTRSASQDISGDSLSKLSSFVHQVGKGQKGAGAVVDQTTGTSANGQSTGNETNTEGGGLQEALGAAAGHGFSFQELWLRFVKKEENAEIKRLNEAKQIFTCLQCHDSFQTMEQLVKHMETTQHYANIPKHYSWSLQYARQRMRQMKMKMKYSDKMMYYCFLCTAPFTEPVHVHFNCVHNMHNPVENMKFVHVISVNGKGSSGKCTSGTSNGRCQPTEEDSRLLVSPVSVEGSSCESAASVSPSPSSSSKRSASQCPPPAYSPSNLIKPIHCRVTVNSPGAYTDNLLLKMEKLVQMAVGEKEEKKNEDS